MPHPVFPYGAGTPTVPATPAVEPEVPRAGWTRVTAASMPRFEHLYVQAGGGEQQFQKVSPPDRGWVTLSPVAIGPDIDFVLKVRRQFAAFQVKSADPATITTTPMKNP